MKTFFILIVFFGQLWGAQQEESILTPPNPSELKASWWSYYAVDPERLAVRIQKTNEVFEHLSMELPEAILEEASPIMREVLVKLTLYREMIIKPVILRSVEKHDHETYTLQEFLGLIDQYNQLVLMSDMASHQIIIEKANLRSDQSYVDAQFAAYLSSSKSDPTRVVNGLKIMARTIATEIDKKKLTTLETEKQYRTGAVEVLQKELTIARERINPSSINLSALENDLAKFQSLRNQSQESLIYLQAKAENYWNMGASQQVLLQTLKQAQAEALLIEAKLKLILGLAVQQSKHKSAKQLYQQLALIEDERKLIGRELRDWKSAADLYYEFSLDNNGVEAVTLAQNIGAAIRGVEQHHRYNGYLFEQCDQIIRLYYSSFEDRFAEYWESFVFKWKQYSSWTHKSMFKLGQAPITFYGLLKVLFIIFVAYFIAKFSRLLINKFGEKQRRIQQAGIYSLGRILYYVIFILGIIIGISSIGLDFTAFAVIAGALSVGIGFGLQSIVNNFVSGIILLLEKKLRMGDLIQLESGEIGRVIEVNVRTTLVRTFDNLEILVPNADFVSKRFINWTLTDRIRRVRIPFGVAYGSDKTLVKKAAFEAAMNIPMTLSDKEPQLWLTKFGESSLDFELVVWVNESLVSAPPMGTAAWYTWELESTLRANGIEIPYPVRDVRLTRTS